ncbi:hypothetical protein [Hymenobacter nivis]|uniref:Uncharacterized protein n=1 Tax=Hymenobacter nivis TaxID=1850093 RepID=A0A2Z3GQU8_9BACT|nr:hypothetical protein [Hymenobacter nivis]AWM34831.1 hypothetical protein DDQ68_19840 [Hymenobacter nivis]
MNNSRFLAVLLLALPVAARAQTKPATKTTTAAKPATEQVTEVTEDLDPATGKVIRRTTRTTTLPAGTPLPGSSTVAADGRAADSQVSDFFREKTTVGALTAPALLDAYSRFIEKVRADRRGWNSASWANAAAVLSSLNGRYEQVRSDFVLDDKVTIRSQQAEFQALRTARQISDQVSDKL